MQSRNFKTGLLIASVLSIMGCSASAGFGGLRANQLQACERLQDRDERERCRARAPQSYEAYEKERKARSENR